MARFEVTAPDGHKYEVEAPDSATDAEIQAYVKHHYLDAKADTPERSRLDAAMIAAGYGVDRLAAGAKDLFYQATGNDGARDQLAKEQAVKKSLMQPLEEEHPAATMAGGMLPYFAVPIGAAAGTIGKGLSMLPKLGNAGQKLGKSGLADSVLAGAATGGVDYDAAALEGAAGGALGYGVGRALFGGKPMRQNPDVEKAESLGLKLTPGQRTGSSYLQKMEASMESMPGLSGGFAKIKKHNQELVNEKISKAIGAGSHKEITDTVIDDAFENYGKKFNEIFDGVADIKIDNGFLDDLVRIEAGNNRALIKSDKVAQIVDKTLDRVSDGSITPKEYQLLVSEIGQNLRSAYRGDADPNLGQALGSLKNAFDDLAFRAVGEEKRPILSQARKEYRNLINLLKRPTNVTHEGNISHKGLANTLKAHDKRGYRRGKDKSDYYDTLRSATRFGQVVGDSGTATRLSLPLLGLGMTVTGEGMNMDALRNAGLLIGAGGLMGRGYLNGPSRSGLMGMIGKLPDQAQSSLNRLSGRAGAGLLAY